MKPLAFVTMALAGLVSMAQAQDLTTEEIIALARSAVADETTLTSIEALSYVGDVTIMPREDEIEARNGSMELHLKRETDQLRITEVSGVVDRTVINEYFGWSQITPADAEEPLPLRWLSSGQRFSMRANTWENLNFFLPNEEAGVELVNEGVREHRGHSCHVLLYQYPTGMSFQRFIDVETGALISTFNQDGLEMVEEGDQLIDGINFPVRLLQYNEGELLNIVEFTSIVVNPEFDETTFALPE